MKKCDVKIVFISCFKFLQKFNAQYFFLLAREGKLFSSVQIGTGFMVNID